MNVKQFIEILQEYPPEEEIFMGDIYNDNDWKIFKVCEIKDSMGDGKTVRICKAPHTVEDIKTFEDIGENNTYNVYDEFKLYSYKTGDCFTWKDDTFTLIYENLVKDNDMWETHNEYYSPDLHYVGGLIKFLQCFDKNTKVNLRLCDGYGSGVIHKAYLENVCYLVGTYDNVDEECQDELFFEYGKELYGGGTLSLQGSELPYKSTELMKILARPIIQKLNEDGKEIPEDDNKRWGKVIDELYDNLVKNFIIRRRVNGSVDSNGYTHLFDKEVPFKTISEVIKQE